MFKKRILLATISLILMRLIRELNLQPELLLLFQIHLKLLLFVQNNMAKELYINSDNILNVQQVHHQDGFQVLLLIN